MGTQYRDTADLVVLTAEAVEQHRNVRHNGSGLLVYADAGEMPLGPAEEYKASGEPLTVKLLTNKPGTVLQIASGAIDAYADVYQDADGKVTATNKGVKVGKNLAGAATADGDVIEVMPAVENSLAGSAEIWVDANSGNDTTGKGTRSAPMKTIEAAFALKSATRNVMHLLPGTYIPAATMTLPAYDFKFIGHGGPELVIVGGGDALTVTHLFTRSAGALTATTTFLWQDLDLNHGATYDGVRVDNTTAGKKIFLTFFHVECEGEGSTGRPVNVHTHGDTGNAVKIVADLCGCEWEGEVYFAVGNSSDLIEIKNGRLTGGFVTNATATAMKVILKNLVIPAVHATGGASQQVVNVWTCVTESGNNLTEAVAADIGGSQTVRVLAFDAP